MESLLAFASERVELAPLLFFFLILLAGVNVPISEDVILISAGALTSTHMPQHVVWIFLLLLLACWIAAWEAYWIGRILGPKLYEIKWFNWILTKEKVEKLHHYYERFGVFTFIAGRFVPGGVRNALFMSSGLGKMPFHKFILRDLVGCSISCSLLFYIGYAFGQNIHTVMAFLKKTNVLAILIVAVLLLVILGVALYRSLKPKKTSN